MLEADHLIAPRPSALEQVLRNLRVLVSGEAASKGFRFAAALILARALGPSEFGVFNLGVAGAGILIIVSALGLPDVASREVALQPARSSNIAGRVIGSRLVFGAVGGLIAGATVIAVVPQKTTLALAGIALVLAVGGSVDWLLRGLARAHAVAIATAAGGAVALVVAGAVALSGAGPAAALAGFAAAEAVSALICWRLCRREERPRPTLAGLGALLRLSWPVAVSAVSFYIYYANFDTIMLASFGSTEQAGVYSAAYRLFLGLSIVGAYVSRAGFRGGLDARFCPGGERGSGDACTEEVFR